MGEFLRIFTVWAAFVCVAASGTVGGAEERPEPIEVERVVNGSREAVWRAWTTDEGAREFFSPFTRIELEIGGAYEIYFAEAPEGKRGSEGCRVLSYVPGEMLSFSWNAPPQLAHARERRTWVVVRLEDAGEGKTRVRLTHLGWAEQERANPDHVEEWRLARGYFERAWPNVMGNLAKRFDEGPLWED